MAERTRAHDGDWQAKRWGDRDSLVWKEPQVERASKHDGYPRSFPFRTCGYCGSIHPLDLLAAMREYPIRLDPADWKYANPPGVTGFRIIHTWETLLSDQGESGESWRLCVLSALKYGKYLVTASMSPDSPKTLWVGPSVNVDPAQSAISTPLGSLDRTLAILQKLDGKSSESGPFTTSEDSVETAGSNTTEPTLPSSTSTIETPAKKTSTSPSDGTPENESEPNATSATSSAPIAIDSDTVIAIEQCMVAGPRGWPHKFYVEGIPNSLAGEILKYGSSSRVDENGVRTEKPMMGPQPDTVHAKFYANHMKDLEPDDFEALSVEIEKRTRTRFEMRDGKLWWKGIPAGIPGLHY